MNFKLDFLSPLRNFRFDGFKAEVTSFSYIKCKKNKIKKKKKKKKEEEEEEEEEEERMNEVKDENFKHSTYIALSCFYMGQSLLWTNNIII